MQQQDGMPGQGTRDARESELSTEGHHPVSDTEVREMVAADRQRKFARWPLLGGGLLMLVLLAAIAIELHSRGVAEERLAASTTRSAVLDVAVTRPKQQVHPLPLVLPADTQAYIDTPIYARTDGYIKKWYTDIGAQVHKGEVLAVIEEPELDQQVDQARSNLATAQANLYIARITAERYTKLVVKNAVSKQGTDQAVSNLKAQISNLAAAKANLRRLEQLQSYETIYAPFSGVITQRNIDIGSLIQAGNSNTPGSQLFHLDAINELRLYVPLPEVYVSAIHIGEQVPVTSDAYPNELFHGTIVRTSDSINLTTRTLNVEVDVNNRDHKLLPGQYAFVHFGIPAAKGAMLLPSNTLLFRTHGLRVGVVKDGRVQLVPIKIGRDYGAQVEVISGLSPSDQVILNPSDSLAQGERVRIVKGFAE
ncbi:MAG: efflux RND transporter periplasmic adaptor subunit [Acidobacteria bacterium]|jgi:RND family efflux transporter MFP subunit|nr:efflux RND transporter periplasmic adaptor subunit [Acidobacteriota bacterium]